MIQISLLAVALLAFAPGQAVPCWVVKRAVAQYGEAAVESWARARGASDKEIEKARRCLK
jgi:hypothetical protein